jgi:antitoxin MazE
MKVKVVRWGNSYAVRLPKRVADEHGLRPGSQLELTIVGGEIHGRPIRASSRELLERMIAEAKRLGPENEPEAVDWGPDRGSEIIDDEYSRGEIKP